jgi:two-component system response regulator HydG
VSRSGLASEAVRRGRESRRALLTGRYEDALRLLREGTATLRGRRALALEIRALWAAAVRLMWATRRITGEEHLRFHECPRPGRLAVEAVQFDVGTLLELSRARLHRHPDGRRWFRRALADISRREDAWSAWRRLVHLAIRLTRSDRGVLLRVEEGEVRVEATSDARGIPLPPPAVRFPRGSALSAGLRGRERLPGWRRRDGGRELVVPVPGDAEPRRVLHLMRRGRAPRFGEERRQALREFLRLAGPAAARVEGRIRERAHEKRRRAEERRLRQERAEARARQKRYLESIRSARRNQEEIRATLRYRYERIVGSGGRMHGLLRSLDRVIPTDAPLLLLGETGTGKELVARAIHENSRRREGPFVSLNGAALPESLVEVELFGCRRGSYTDADRDRTGRIRDAHGGTFFLDEVGELSLPIQGKLLRVLEAGEVRPVGSHDPHHVNVRLVAATNRDLEAEVDAGTMRADLYHRLKVVTLTLPPLRERIDDLPLLAEHFLQAHSRGAPPAVSPEALDRLREHDWPGNIRELEMCLRVALVLCEGPSLRPEHIQIHPIRPPFEETGADPSLPDRHRRLLREWPRHRPLRCSEVAARFGVSKRTASRDLAALVRSGHLVKRGGGPTTCFLRREEA